MKLSARARFWRWVRKSRLPLLVKELTEQAARRRTYLVRVAYALALFSWFFLTLRSELRSAGGNPENMLGRGRGLLAFIVGLQIAAIYAFLPAMMSGVLTYEKERDSLSLLFLTDLRPWEIILQKYLGRLITMLTFLLLSMPLTALAFSLGGITPDMLVGSGCAVLITCLEVGALALMCSAYCRTSLGAFLLSYAGCGIIYYLGLVVPFGPLLAGASSGDLLPKCEVALVATGVFLLFARSYLISRAFVAPRNTLLNFFRRLDRFWESMNYLTGGIVLIKDRNTLPGNRPIFWRETVKRSLGKPHYLFRVLVFLELPVAFFAVLSSYDSGPWRPHPGMSWLVFVSWVIAALWTVSAAANAVATERTDQTLEVLLTTPISGRQIVRQKMAAVRRLVIVLTVPLFTIFLLEVFLEARRSNENLARYIVSSLLSLLIYPQMLAWFALWIGMKSASRMKAILVSLVLLVLWCVLPIVLAQATNQEFWAFLSPAAAVIGTELNVFPCPQESILPVIFLNYLWYGGILLYFRWRCLKAPTGRWAGCRAAAERGGGNPGAPLAGRPRRRKHERESNDSGFHFPCHSREGGNPVYIQALGTGFPPSRE